MNNVYIGIGSNLGDRLQHLRSSLNRIKAHPKVNLIAVSSIYETAPIGGPPQDPFLNGTCAVKTSLRPAALLGLLLDTEERMGRIRRERWGPRVIDLDLLLYGEWMLKTPTLEIPHPRLAERSFVLVPLAEIAPAAPVPGTGRTVQELLQDLPPTGVQLFRRRWFPG